VERRGRMTSGGSYYSFPALGTMSVVLIQCSGLSVGTAA
jgi:hypothetical protein